MEDEKLDLNFVMGALKSKDDTDALFILNLLVTQNLRDHFNEDQVKQLTTALMYVSASQTEPVEVDVHSYGVGWHKTIVKQHVYTNIVGTIGRRDRLKSDKKFQKMNPFKQAEFLIRKMLYVWKELNGIRNHGDWNQS